MIGRNPLKPLATLWRLKDRPSRDLPVMVAGFSLRLGGGDPLTSKRTRSKRRKRWPKGWLGYMARLAGTHGRIWNSPRQVLHGMTFAPLQDLTFASITEKRTNRKRTK